ncbi:CCGSCS motif protein [Halomonas sp. E19]|uniref:CCGSCS motif protein n=1 Tax=unclassified Halomonas TaxID=2609666 RepID=UPI004033B8A7
MGLLKTLFKKDKADDKPVVQAYEPAPTTAASADASADEATGADVEKKGKHGEPGVCCGSCSG